MNVLDENIIASQCEQLRRWRIPFRQIGSGMGRKGMDDSAEIIPLLHRLTHATFFTRDAGFYRSALCHDGYCLVVLSVSKDEAAHYVRRFLRHPDFSTRAKRMGHVVRLNATGVFSRRKGTEQEQRVPWPRERRR